MEAVGELLRLSSNDGRSLCDLTFYGDEVSQFAVADYRLPPPDDDPWDREKGRAYTVFFWASLAHSERELYHRFEALPEAFRARLGGAPYEFSPSRVNIVADGEWGASRALFLAAEALRDWIEPDHLTAWFRSEGSWRFAPASQFIPSRLPTECSLQPQLFPLRPVLGELVVEPYVGNPSGNIERRIARSPWSGRTGADLFELLTLVAQHPVASVDHYTAWLREPGNATRIQQRVGKLIDLGLIRMVTEKGYASDGNLNKDGRRNWYKSVAMAISELGQGKPRYALTWEGVRLVCKLHLGNSDSLWKDTKSP